MSEVSVPLPAAAALRPARLCSDAQLARRAAGGDQRAFAEIFERHHQAVYRYCRSILGNGEDAADALQSTMAAVLRSLNGETREIALKPWLFRIAHNEALSILRRARPQSELDDLQPCTRSGVEAGVLASEHVREVVEDVQALPDRQRGALVMRELNGLEYGEIAAAFGVAEGAARQAVYEARSMLHELAEGRAMACADVRELISARDGRLLRGRKVRAHLRACESCTQFRAAIDQRQAGLALAAPPLAAPLAASILHGLLGGGHGAAATGAAAGGGVTAAASAAPLGETAAVAGIGAKAAGTAGLGAKAAGAAALGVEAVGTAGIATKAVAVLAATAALGGGAAITERQLDREHRPSPPAVASLDRTTSGKPAGAGVATGVMPPARQRSSALSAAEHPLRRSRERAPASGRRNGAGTSASTPGAKAGSRRPATPATRPGAEQAPARRPSSTSTAAPAAGAGPSAAGRRTQTTATDPQPSTSPTRPTPPAGATDATPTAPPVATRPQTTQSAPQPQLPAIPQPDSSAISRR